MPQPRLILFRKSRLEDEYEALFQHAGWQVHSIPVLAFRYKNEEMLRSRLHDAGGLIITSPRAGNLVGKMLAEDAALCERWKGHPIVCIGRRSAEKLQDAGVSPRISEHATGGGLAEEVMQVTISSPWLFVCGNLRRDELPDTLLEGNVPFEELEVYETLMRQDLKLESFTIPDWVVFFSPSGLETVKPQWPPSWDDVRIAAIGSTTAAAIEAEGLHVSATAATPDPQSLLKALTP